MKAILVIDINGELLEDYDNFYVDYYLRAKKKNTNVDEIVKYVEYCNLKLLPNKIKIPSIPENVSHWAWAKYKYHAKGWNDCLDELLGEDNET